MRQRYWEYKIIAEVKTQFRREFQTYVPTRPKSTRIGDEVETNEIVPDVQQGKS